VHQREVRLWRVSSSHIKPRVAASEQFQRCVLWNAGNFRAQAVPSACRANPRVKHGAFSKDTRFAATTSGAGRPQKSQFVDPPHFSQTLLRSPSSRAAGETPTASDAECRYASSMPFTPLRQQVAPNPSLELTRSGRPCKPGLSQQHYRLSPGLHGLPARAAQLER
jgi:hypothetical protein